AASPDLLADREAALELVYTELVLRLELKQNPDPAEYYRRFPAWADRLRRLLEVHQLMCTRGGEDPASKRVRAAFTIVGREAPGAVIGPYKLLEQIGEGGFGVVFMAEQTQPVRRKVALKVLKPGMDTRQVIARFEAERQALALMDHPNIAHVLDGGE